MSKNVILGRRLVEVVVSHFHAYETGNEASLWYEIKFGNSVMQ